MKISTYTLAIISLLTLSSCGAQSANNIDEEKSVNSLAINSTTPETDSTTQNKAPESSQPKMATAAEILAKKQVPVLCYHQIRDWKATDSKTAKDIITPIAIFEDQIKTLADSGYTSIMPNQLYDYLLYGKELPKKPFMITFDDNDLSQYENATPILTKYGFKGVYFIMTVTIGRPRYMNKTQLKELADNGNAIESHTWDHHNVQKYMGEDWVTQIEKPSKVLEDITGKKVEYFAYPFGLWNPQGIPELEKRGMKAAFILATKRDENKPLYTIRRMIASGFWNGKTMHQVMEKTFSQSRN